MPKPDEIEEHTDNRPISKEDGKSNNWLSKARALKVLDIVVDEVGMDPGRLSAVGYGEYRPVDPAVDNDAEENRAINRRVEIKVRYTEGEEEIAPENVRQLLEEAELGVQGDE